VDGEQALAFVRVRHGIGDGSDLSRIKRQQAFLSAVVREATSTGLLLQVRGLEPRNVRFVTVPTRAYPADPNRVQWTPAAAALWEAIRLDQPLPSRGTSQPAVGVSPAGAPLTVPPGGSPCSW
jgi:LytR_cpsA_psr family